MRHRAALEAIVVALGLSFSRLVPGPQITSLVRAMREDAARRRSRPGRP
jgi:hypothetical protein